MPDNYMIETEDRVEPIGRGLAVPALRGVTDCGDVIASATPKSTNSSSLPRSWVVWRWRTKWSYMGGVWPMS